MASIYVTGGVFAVTLPISAGQVVGQVSASYPGAQWNITDGDPNGFFAIDSSGTVTLTQNAVTLGISPGLVSLTTQATIEAPIIYDISPWSAVAGNTVTISGAWFTNVTQVDFGAVPASFTIINDSTITATVPDPSAGIVEIAITSPFGTSPPPPLGPPIEIPPLPGQSDSLFMYSLLAWDVSTAVNVTVTPQQLDDLRLPNGEIVQVFQKIPLTVINTGGSINTFNSGVQGPAAAAKFVGRYYFEINFLEFATPVFEGGIVIAAPGQAYDVLAAFAGGFNPDGTDGSGGVMLQGNGNIFSNGNHICTMKGIKTGDTVGVAIDLLNGFVWFQVVAGPSEAPTWNGGVLGNGSNNGIGAGSDPVTGELGVAIPSSAAMIPYFLFSGDTKTGDTIVANFGQNVFDIAAGVAPQGYTFWPGT